MKKLILLTPLLLSGCFIAPQQGYHAQAPIDPPAYSGPSYDNFSQRRMEQQDRIAEENYRQQHIQQLEQQNRLQQQNRYAPAFENPNWYDNR